MDNPFQVQEDDDLTIIKKGKPVNYFIMIVEGKVNVTIGGEELEFEAGPFSYYGIKALTQVTQSMAAAVDGKAPGSVHFLFKAFVHFVHCFLFSFPRARGFKRC